MSAQDACIHSKTFKKFNFSILYIMYIIHIIQLASYFVPISNKLIFYNNKLYLKYLDNICICIYI